MKFSTSTIGILIVALVMIAVFVLMVKRPAIENKALVFGVPEKTVGIESNTGITGLDAATPVSKDEAVDNNAATVPPIEKENDYNTKSSAVPDSAEQSIEPVQETAPVLAPVTTSTTDPVPATETSQPDKTAPVSSAEQATLSAPESNNNNNDLRGSTIPKSIPAETMPPASQQESIPAEAQPLITDAPVNVSTPATESSLPTAAPILETAPAPETAPAQAASSLPEKEQAENIIPPVNKDGFPEIIEIPEGLQIDKSAMPEKEIQPAVQ